MPKPPLLDATVNDGWIASLMTRSRKHDANQKCNAKGCQGCLTHPAREEIQRHSRLPCRIEGVANGRAGGFDAIDDVGLGRRIFRGYEAARKHKSENAPDGDYWGSRTSAKLDED